MTTSKQFIIRCALSKQTIGYTCSFKRAYERILELAPKAGEGNKYLGVYAEAYDIETGIVTDIDNYIDNSRLHYAAV